MPRIIKALWLTGLACAFFVAVAEAAVITGTPRDDTLIGTADDDRIDARAGRDRVLALGGDDSVEGAEGDDELYGDGTCTRGSRDGDYCSTGESGADGDDRIDGERG